MWEKKENDTSDPKDDFAVRSSTPAPSAGDGRIVNIGQSILIKGELTGSENLTIDGQVDGKISLKDHNLTIGQHGRIHAELVARAVTILGKVQGNVRASEKVEILKGGRLDGDITAPRIAIADGAHFRGKVDMEAKAVPEKAAVQVSGGTAR